MSISTIRNFLEKSGCAMVVSIALAIMFVIGFLMIANPNAARGGGGDSAPLLIAQIGKTPVTFDEVDDLSRQQTQQYFAQLESVPPELEASVLGGVLRQLINQSLVMELAQREGVSLTDDQILSMVAMQFDQSVASEKTRLVSEGKLKAGATAAEVDEAFKKEGGQTLGEIRAKNEADVKKMLADPTGRTNLVAYFTNQALVNEYKKQSMPTDEQLKKSFDTLTVKRIVFNGLKGDPMAEAKKVADEIKGGLSFEQAIDRHSTETPTEGKKLSESTTSLTVGSIEGLPDYQPVLALKPGEVSAPIASGAGAIIYKLVERKNVLPPDFDKEKARYADAYATQAANRKVTAAVDKLRDEGLIQWKSEGYHVLYDFVTLLDQGDPATHVDQFRELEERAAALGTTGDPAGAKPAALVRYLALQRLPAGTTEEEKDTLAEKKLEAIGNLLLSSENAELRLQMVDLLIERKDPLAAKELLTAAENNTSPTEVGQRTFSDVGARLTKLKEQKLGTPEEIAAIEKELERWRQEKKEYDQGQEEMKKLEEQQRKEAEADAKAEDERAKKVNPVERGATPPPSSDSLSGAKSGN
ncbi:MAG: SurA N-terminal domain-containing protein [Fimbriimonadaceae bacterium]|nr:SurA N-terminal domain-containing protein [Fimbriimonadaceae bacterium]